MTEAPKTAAAGSIHTAATTTAAPNAGGAGLVAPHLVGTGMARFLNQYDPTCDKPYQRLDMNRGQILDEELTELLRQERSSQEFRRHIKKKDWIKHYMDECVKFQAIVKSGGSTGGSKK